MLQNVCMNKLPLIVLFPLFTKTSMSGIYLLTNYNYSYLSCVFKILITCPLHRKTSYNEA